MIELKHVGKKIKGKVILDDINCTLEYGKVYGLCGHNGSGKTMLLRAIAGLITVNEGVVMIDGQSLHKDISFPNNVGIVIENMELLPSYTAYQNLSILSEIKNLVEKEEISHALQRVGLEKNKDTKVKNFSLGMKQRLNIAQAIFEKQTIILLDEPTNAIDEEGVELIYKIIREEKERGAVIVIATHHEQDLESVCDEIFRMKDGRMQKRN